MANKRAPSQRMLAMPGHCIVCAGVIPLIDLWCDEHRKRGAWVVNGKTMPWTYDESERNHGDRMRELILKGRV